MGAPYFSCFVAAVCIFLVSLRFANGFSVTERRFSFLRLFMLLLAGLLGLLGLVGLVGILTGVTVCMEIDISSTGMIRMILMVEMRVRRVLVRERVEDVVNWTNCPFVADPQEKEQIDEKTHDCNTTIIMFCPFCGCFCT